MRIQIFLTQPHHCALFTLLLPYYTMVNVHLLFMLQYVVFKFNGNLPIFVSLLLRLELLHHNNYYVWNVYYLCAL